MRDKRLGTFLLVAAMLIAGSLTLSAQQISGTISGSVRDSQQAAIASAKLVLTNPEQGISRDAVSRHGRQSFVFAQVQPGTYNLTIESPGSSDSYKRKLSYLPTIVFVLGDIILEVGAVSESVTVEAQAAAVQTASAERSGVSDQPPGG